MADSAEPACHAQLRILDPAPIVPRKLPTSPMDVAAEEFRQRDVAAAPAEPEFNLEDELNALLGNIKSNQAAALPRRPSRRRLRAACAAYEPPAYQPAMPDLYEAASPAAYEPESPHLEQRPEEIVSFDPPEHPVDIDDDLNWELDDVFAAEAAPEPVEEDQAEEGQAEAYADEDQPEAYAEDGRYGAYAEAEQPEDAYAAEEPAPIEFEDDDFDLSAEDIQPEAPRHITATRLPAPRSARPPRVSIPVSPPVRSRRRRAARSARAFRGAPSEPTPSARIATRSCAATR